MTKQEFYNKFNTDLDLDNKDWDLPNIIYSVKKSKYEDWYVQVSLKNEINREFLYYIVQDNVWCLKLSDVLDEDNKPKFHLPIVVSGKLRAVAVANHYLTKCDVDLHKENREELIKAIASFTPVEKVNKAVEGYKETEGKLEYELDFEFIQDLAKRMNKNKSKYAIYNWKKPIDIDSLKQSLFRHVIEIMLSNYKDAEEEYGHLIAVSANCMILNYQLKYNKNEV